ncbi:MAG: 4-hydroxy-tetrahydrodipicolinate synthase [Candidatus Omnitrophica bacterium]|nr:4-hydroxy-tetrahydrodipicolinate synthase [Candidatus Omnitrophota bacterium]
MSAQTNKKSTFEGSMVALVTPFRETRVDEKALYGLLDFHLKNKTDVIIPCGTTGESATMSHEEHKSVMSMVVNYVKGRVPVICGAGSNNTQEALGLVLYAQKIKADGVLLVTPYYNKPTQEGLYRHYEFLASKSDIPIVLYNVPGRTGVNLAPETVARLAMFDNVKAVKEASGNLDQVDRILDLCDITVLSGDDGLTVPMIAIGARGVISVTANVVPDLMSKMVHAALEEDFPRARKIHRELYRLNKLLFIETNPIPVKTALGLMGKIKPEMRLPLCEMSKQNAKCLADELKSLGVIS